MVVGHIVARVGSSRLVVGPCILCSLRSGVALAPEIIFFAPLWIVTKQEPLCVLVRSLEGHNNTITKVLDCCGRD